MTSSNLEKVEKDKKYLESFNYTPFIDKVSDKNNNIWYKLKLGPYNKEDASKINEELFQNLQLDARISIE